jgi:hypothetical protein
MRVVSGGDKEKRVSQQQVPAGWYPDPDPASTGERYWDGQAWSEHARAKPTDPGWSATSDLDPSTTTAQGAQGSYEPGPPSGSFGTQGGYGPPSDYGSQGAFNQPGAAGAPSPVPASSAYGPSGYPNPPAPYDSGYAPSPYGMPQGYPTASPGFNGLSIASMVLGILWLYWVGSILAVIFGHVALRQIRRTGQRGRGMAIAGLVLGYIGLAALVTVIIIGISVAA